jgi:homoserine O-acetyltransferase
MNSHDVGRGRGSVEAALATVKAISLVAGIDSDRCFPIGDQKRIADHIGGTMIGGGLQTITSSYGHDGFLIERDLVGPLLTKLLES